ncbi:hypothetical protein AAF712_000271 [Marasmius tenuissimus]|uniref:DUF7330 domain-containing protein n=1 Tax=Marasmius tenuissimus TaxID=585030 RepID=A0ABR3AFK5_9AGAR
MIVPDDAPVSPLKSQMTDGPDGRQQPPPPSYGAVVNQVQGQLSRPHLQIRASHSDQIPAGSSYHHVIVPPSPHYPQLDEQQRQRAKKRFCGALCSAILIYILVAMFFGSVFSDRSVLKRDWFENIRGQLPAGITVDSCTTAHKSGSQAEYLSASIATATFDFPVTSEALLVVARGSISEGQIRINSDTSGSDSSDVKLEVSIRYYHEDTLNNAKLCRIRRRNGEVGLAILTPKWWPHRRQEDSIYVDLHLSLPASSTKALTIKRLETDLPNYSHHIGDLQDKVNFQNLILKSSNQPIAGQSLAAQDAQITTTNSGTVTAPVLQIQTTNGVITGHYSSSGSLSLVTDNSPIKVEVDMNATKSDAGNLYAKTSNSPIDANVNFHAYDKHTPGKFTFNAVTSNGGLRLNVQDMPLGSALNMDATTSNGLVNVGLPSAYEGTFALSTSNSNAPTVSAPTREDPWGKRRSRGLEQLRRGGSTTGKVYWGPENANKSRLVVRTSNAPVTLAL